jgi:hypothetical protein
MCDKCAELDKRIEHYQRMLLSIGDQTTVERLRTLIGDLQAQKATFHPEQKQRGRLSQRRRTPAFEFPLLSALCRW